MKSETAKSNNLKRDDYMAVLFWIIFMFVLANLFAIIADKQKDFEP